MHTLMFGFYSPAHGVYNIEPLGCAFESISWDQEYPFWFHLLVNADSGSSNTKTLFSSLRFYEKYVI